jgi:hypothetical protein
MVIGAAMREGLGSALEEIRRHYAVTSNDSENSTHLRFSLYPEGVDL